MDNDHNAHAPQSAPKGSNLPLIGAVIMAGLWVAYGIYFFTLFAGVV